MNVPMLKKDAAGRKPWLEKAPHTAVPAPQNTFFATCLTWAALGAVIWAAVIHLLFF
jgi:hypothetical protein